VRVTIPPLRERLEDLPLLVENLASSVAVQPAVLQRLPTMLPLLRSYRWPGNVRELRNFVERLAVLSSTDALPTALRSPARQEGAPATGAPEHEDPPPLFSAARQRAIDAFERSFVCDLLERTAGNVTLAAQLAGVSRRYLTRLMAKYDIDRLAPDGAR
jgi:DNA-binding NtrC family response regulator